MMHFLLLLLSLFVSTLPVSSAPEPPQIYALGN